MINQSLFFKIFKMVKGCRGNGRKGGGPSLTLQELQLHVMALISAVSKQTQMVSEHVAFTKTLQTRIEVLENHINANQYLNPPTTLQIPLIVGGAKSSSLSSSSPHRMYPRQGAFRKSTPNRVVTSRFPKAKH